MCSDVELARTSHAHPHHFLTASRQSPLPIPALYHTRTAGSTNSSVDPACHHSQGRIEKTLVIIGKTLVIIWKTLVIIGKTLVIIGKTLVIIGKTLVIMRHNRKVIHYASVSNFIPASSQTPPTGVHPRYPSIPSSVAPPAVQTRRKLQVKVHDTSLSCRTA